MELQTTLDMGTHYYSGISGFSVPQATSRNGLYTWAFVRNNASHVLAAIRCDGGALPQAPRTSDDFGSAITLASIQK